MKIKTVLGMGLLVGSFVSSAFADTQSVDVNAVQAAIAKAHAGWRAKPTWVSQLPKDQIKRMLGLKALPKGNLDFESIGRHGFGAGSLDWRNVNGINWLGPVMNQGNCGSCVAFSTVATLEAQTAISAGAPWLRATYSPEMLFMCGGASCETGWMPDDAADFLQHTGIV